MATIRLAQLFTLMLLCVVIVKSIDQQCDSCTDHRPVLHLLSLLPYPDPEGVQPSWTEGPTLFIAEQLAVDLINNRSDILPDYRLELIRGDSGCNIKSKALVTFLGVLYSEINIAGIVGPGCSTSSVTVSPLSGNNNIALINIHVAGSLLLEDRTRYPYSFGTLDSTKAFAKTSLALMKKNNWNRVGALYDPNRVYYSSTLRYLEQLIVCQDNLECSTNFIFGVQETFIPIDVLRDSYIRVIFLFVGPDLLSKILCIAFHKGLVFPTYQWIVVSRVISEITPVSFTLRDRLYTCSENDMRIVTDGVLILHYSLEPIISGTITDTAITYEQFLNMYTERATSAEFEPSFWATSYFDAVWSLALALNNSREEMKEITGLDLSEYRYGHRNATDIVRKNLLQLDFNGVSGRIRFKNSTGYVPRNIDIYQISNVSDMQIVAYYDSENDSLIGVTESFRFVNDTFRQELINVSVHLALGSVLCLLTLVGLILIIILHILTVVFRNRKSVRASSPKLSHVAFIGSYILVVGAISYTIAETFSGTIDSYIKCNLIRVTYFASSTGSTLILGTICAHTWRLYRIYVHYLRPGRLITEKILLSLILLLFLWSVFLCSLWLGFDKLVPTESRTQVVMEIEDSDGNSAGFDIQIFVHVDCLQYPESLYWLSPQLVFNLLLMIVAVWLAILTRNIPHKDFKTKRIIFLVYILAGVLILGYVTSYILLARNASRVIQFTVLSIVQNAVIYITAFLLLLPPLYAVLKELRVQNYSVATETLNL